MGSARPFLKVAKQVIVSARSLPKVAQDLRSTSFSLKAFQLIALQTAEAI